MRKVEQEIDKLLDQYLDGRLSTDEVRLLHRQLETGKDPNDYSSELDEWVSHVSLPDDLLDYTPTKLAKTTQKKQQTTAQTQDLIPIISIRQVLLFGIIFIFMLSLSLYWYVLPFEKNHALFDKYFQPPPLSDITFIANAQKDSDLWRGAIFKYNEKKYDFVVKDLEKLKTQDNDAPNTLLSNENYNLDAINLLIGVCQLANDRAYRALPYLTNLAASDSPLHSQAEWFMALAYVRNADLGRARFCLEQITQNPNAYNYNMAQTLLSDLRDY